MTHLVTRMLDDLYWVMSYSRWQDERFWPLFRDALIAQHPGLTEAGLQKAREFNFQRYHFQGIGRYDPDAAYARGLADLQVLSRLLPPSGYVHGAKPTSIDAGIYGFVANIYFYNPEGIDTVEELKKVLPYVTSVHLKESAKGEPRSFDFPVLGTGIVDFPEVFRLLGEHGFAGPYTLELEGPLVNGLPVPERIQKVEACLEYLKEIGALE